MTTPKVFGEETDSQRSAREETERRESARRERERTVKDSLPSPSEQATAEPAPDSRPDPKTALANLLSGPSIKPAPSDTEATFSEAADTETAADAELEREGPGPVSELLSRLRASKKVEAENEGDQNANGIPDGMDEDREQDDAAIDADKDGELDQLEDAQPDESTIDSDGDGVPNQLDSTPEGDQQAPQRVQRRELDLTAETDPPRTKSGGLDVDGLNTRSALEAEQQENRRLRRQGARQPAPTLPKASRPAPAPNRGGRGGKERRGILGGFRRRR